MQSWVRGAEIHFPDGRVVKARRRPDIALLSNSIIRPNTPTIRWGNALVLGEFTVTPLKQNGVSNLTSEKYRQLVTNMVDLLVEQPHRLFVAGISVHGQSFVLSILDHEGLHHCLVPSVASTDQLAQFHALMHVLRTASIYELGFSPLFEYSCTSSGDLVPSCLHIPSDLAQDVGGTASRDTQVFKILGDPINSMLRSPFHRATVVWMAERVHTFLETQTNLDGAGEPKALYIKVQWVAEDRVGREPRAIRHLTSTSQPVWAPRLITSLVTDRLACQLPGRLFPPFVSEPMAERRSATARHIEVLVTETLAGGAPISQRTPTTELFAKAFIQLVEAVEFACQRGIMHRDISSGNVLITPDGQLVWIDWECAVTLDASASSQQRTGTLETMSTEALQGGPFLHRPRHDLESVVYLMWRSGMHPSRLKLSDELQRYRAAVLGSAEDFRDPIMLSGKHAALWAINPERKALSVVALLKNLPDSFASLLRQASHIPEIDPNGDHPIDDTGAMDEFHAGCSSLLGALRSVLAT